MFAIDLGGEFLGKFLDMCDEFGIELKAAASSAAWQHGIAERHGGILGRCWEAVTQAVDIDSRARASIALSACCAAKNSTLTRGGLCPEQAVFGRPLRWSEQMLKDDDDPGVAILGLQDGEAYLSSQCRIAARVALIEADASAKLKRAAMRRAPTVQFDLIPGARVYF